MQYLANAGGVRSRGAELESRTARCRISNCLCRPAERRYVHLIQQRTLPGRDREPHRLQLHRRARRRCAAVDGECLSPVGNPSAQTDIVYSRMEYTHMASYKWTSPAPRGSRRGPQSAAWNRRWRRPMARVGLGGSARRGILHSLLTAGVFGSGAVIGQVGEPRVYGMSVRARF